MFNIKIEELRNESDVEQKFVFPLLTNNLPFGCGIASSDLLTKPSIKKRPIGKGLNRKMYVPDYLVVIEGIAMMVIEVKTPGSNLDDAFSEARLYATEINSGFEHNINPCQKIIVSDGFTTLAGHYDQETPIHQFDFKDTAIENVAFSSFIEFTSFKVINEYFKTIIQKIRGKALYSKPVGKLGGRKTQNEEIGENEVGRILTQKFTNVFIPENEEGYKTIVENAYVESKNRESHVEPILKRIRNSALIQKFETTRLSTMYSEPLLKAISKVDTKEKSLIILLGSVGSGKSTFLRYLKDVVFKRDDALFKSINWCIIDMNNAPLTESEIYKWIEFKIIQDIRNQYTSIDHSSLKFLMELYKSKIDEFKNGVGQLYKEDLYSEKLADYILSFQNNSNYTLKSYIDLIKKNYSKEYIISFDNVDKSSNNHQLLIFQVAQWFKSDFRTTVILPMRDMTYSIYRNTPPLDTVIKDLLFRIDPPDILAVLQRRLDFLVRQDIVVKRRIDEYSIGESSLKVKIKDNEEIDYFKLILVSIRKDDLVKSIFYSISGGNIRQGIEMFIDFCRSGHISSIDIFKIRVLDGDFKIPNHILMNAILRGNRKYYSDNESRMKNIFHSDHTDDWVDPLLRIDILRYLKEHLTEKGQNGEIGFFKSETVIDNLTMIGHNKSSLFREIRSLISAGLIVSENTAEDLVEDDLIKLSVFGNMHLWLLKNVTYLAACSEDVLYNSVQVATEISNRISGQSGNTYLSKINTYQNAYDMVSYLYDYSKKYLRNNSDIYQTINFSFFDFSECFETLKVFKPTVQHELDIIEQKEMFESGSEMNDCIVLSTIDDGVFASLDFKASAFLRSKHLQSLGMKVSDFIPGDILRVKIIAFRDEHKRYEVELIEKY